MRPWQSWSLLCVATIEILAFQVPLLLDTLLLRCEGAVLESTIMETYILSKLVEMLGQLFLPCSSYTSSLLASRRLEKIKRLRTGGKQMSLRSSKWARRRTQVTID